MAADGSLRFDIGINTEGFKEGTSTLKRAADSCAKSVKAAGKGIEDAFNKSTQVSSLENQISQTEAKIRSLTAEMEKMSGASVPTEEYQELSGLVDKTQLKLDGLLERQEKLRSQKVSENSSRWKSLQYDIDETTKRLEIYKAELQDTIDRGRAYTSGSDSEAYAKKEEALESFNNRLYVQKRRLMELTAREARQQERANQKLEETRAKEAAAAAESARLKQIADNVKVSDQAVVDLNNRLQELRKRQKDLQAAGVGFGYQEYDSNAREISSIVERLKEYKAQLQDSTDKTSGFRENVKTAFLSASSSVAGFAKKLGTNLISKAKQSVSSLKKVGKTSDKVSKSILKLSNMFKLMLTRMAMRAAIQGMKDGMQNLVQYSDETNRSISNLRSGMTYLKNSFAAAFAPVLTYVAPVLTTLISLLAMATGYINQFFSALSGGKTFIRAKQVNEDYAKSLKSAGGAAKQAGKDAKKALAPFDDLIQLQQQGADGSGGGGGAGTADPSQMFETVAIDKGISEFADKLKELFDAGDWEGVGKFLGQKVNDAVLRFTDYISWENVGGEVAAFILAFTAIFNSLAATIDWYAVGVMMGTGIDTAVHALYLLLTEIDWQQLGTALALGLNGMVATVDWELFGATIGAYFQAKISALYGFVSTADWPGIGRAIGESLNGMAAQIDWAMLGMMFALGLGGVFHSLGEFALTFDWSGFGSSVATSLSSFFRTFDWIGSGTAVSDFVLGLLDALVTFIKETDWSALGTGVAEMATAIDWWGILLSVIDLILQVLKGVVLAGWPVLKGIAGNLWEGFCEGVKEFFSAPGEFIKKNIVDPFVKYFKEYFGIHSPSTVMAEMGQYLWDGFCKGIKEFFSDPGAFIKANITDPFINKVKEFLGIHSPSTVMKDVGGNTVAGFNQGISNGQSTTQSVVQGWAQGVASWFSQKLGISGGDSAEAQRWAGSTMSGFNNTVNSCYRNSQGVMETWAENVRRWFVGAGNGKGVNQESWRKFADDVIMAFANEITSKHTETQAPTENWAENLRKWFVGENEAQGINELSWTKFADNIIRAFKEKIEGSHTETRQPMETWARNSREWFWGDGNPDGTGGLYRAFYEMARRINEGFANGISDFAYLAKAAIRRWASEIMEEAEEEFDINSPSREFYSIAGYVVKGFNNGIEALASRSKDVAQRWLDGVMDVFDDVGIQIPVGLDIPNAASYLPRMASGGIVPPKAGVMAYSVRGEEGQSREEVLTHLLARLEELIGRLDADKDRPVQIVLNLTGNLAALARILKPELDKEAARKGVSLVIVGGN